MKKLEEDKNRYNVLKEMPRFQKIYEKRTGSSKSIL